MSSTKWKQLNAILTAQHPDINELRTLTWSGLPEGTSWKQRALVWQLLTGYLPLDATRRAEAREERRQTYKRTTDTYYNAFVGCGALGTDEADSISPPLDSHQQLDLGQLRQIRADLSRTKPAGFRELFSETKVQFVLTRALYIYAIRNPGSGYVQGMNDILVPLFIVCLHGDQDGDAPLNVEDLTTDMITNAEADSFFLLQNILSEIQDNYTNGQPGITQQLKVLQAITARVKPKLIEHFDEIGLRISQFAFRWMNCLMSREFDTMCLITLWDTYIAEGAKNLRQLMIFVGAAYLIRLSSSLSQRNFQEAMLFIQSPPSTSWKSREVEMLVAEV
eukprot:Blabericola_migrator_1__9154@NODE_48_length_16467_cov_53_390427_g44_i0_p5_GENE_NODE_48_length_16467_cov_53_390427_g44_i0NODE_48_length_16467_cov_53_390427_g44_i0_p5_ORF_typecomplete_len335_score42_37RabGAPTBC/PF00566_18/4_8e46KCNQ2_u3/PF16642_5/6_9e03KCNQ2_u3/PF16642_5/0_3_NODE_48_length_16467_cov_53_390427_g44_i01077011774